MFAVIILLGFVAYSIRYSTQRWRARRVPVVITGLNPSVEGENGTKVVLQFGGSGLVLDRGYANSEGIFRSSLNADAIGKELGARLVGTSHEIMELRGIVQPYGFVRSVHLIDDPIYIGEGDNNINGPLDEYHQTADELAIRFQLSEFRRTRTLGQFLSDIPPLMWATMYGILLLAFSIDYLMFPESFIPNISGYWEALYLSMVTQTTLGYGDIVPKSNWLRVLVGMQAIVGILIIGLALNSLFVERRDD